MSIIFTSPERVTQVICTALKFKEGDKLAFTLTDTEKPQATHTAKSFSTA
jgi:hypothetical protein